MNWCEMFRGGRTYGLEAYTGDLRHSLRPPDFHFVRLNEKQRCDFRTLLRGKVVFMPLQVGSNPLDGAVPARTAFRRRREFEVEPKYITELLEGLERNESVNEARR